MHHACVPCGKLGCLHVTRKLCKNPPHEALDVQQGGICVCAFGSRAHVRIAKLKPIHIPGRPDHTYLSQYSKSLGLWFIKAR